MLSIALLCALALAGPVTSVPDGAREVGLLLCAADDCSDQLFWVSFEPAFKDEPILLVEALMADRSAAAREDLEATAFAEALERARKAVLDGSWASAEGALDDAGAVLERWQGSPDNPTLFHYWFLKGAVTVLEGRSSGEGSFQRAAAVAWNRSVAAPEGTERFEDAYYEAMEKLLSEPVATLVVPPGPAHVQYLLDGVPLGPGPLRVRVLPGTHVLSARDSRWSRDWQRELSLRPGKETSAEAHFPGEDGDRWAVEALAAAVDSFRLDPEAAELLAGWADRHGIQRVHLLRLDAVDRQEGDAIDAEAGASMPVFEAREAWYDPRLQRFSSRPL